jgi:hypothetical protein
MEKATPRAMLTIPLRQAIKRRLPIWLLRWNKRRKWEPIRQHYAALEVADCFSNIYLTKLWGEADGEVYCSGGGSAPPLQFPMFRRSGLSLRNTKFGRWLTWGAATSAWAASSAHNPVCGTWALMLSLT